MLEEEVVKTKVQTEDETSYPTKKIVIPAMLAIALALFLVALVFCFLLNRIYRFSLTRLTG